MLLARNSVSQSFIPPPPGVMQNLNANIEATAFYKYNIAIQVLAFFSVGSCVFARAYVKLFIKKELKAEDCRLFLSLSCQGS